MEQKVMNRRVRWVSVVLSFSLGAIFIQAREVRFVRMWMQGVCQSPQAAIFSAVGGYPCFQFLLLLGTDMFVGQVTGQQIVNVFILFHGHLQFTRMDKTMAPMAVIRKGFSAA